MCFILHHHGVYLYKKWAHSIYQPSTQSAVDWMLIFLQELTHQCDGVRSSHEGGALWNGLSALIRRDTRDTTSPSLPCEDTARRQPSANQIESSHQEPCGLAFWSWTFSLQTVRNKFFLFKPLSLWHLINSSSSWHGIDVLDINKPPANSGWAWATLLHSHQLSEAGTVTSPMCGLRKLGHAEWKPVTKATQQVANSGFEYDSCTRR